ncbi:serine hydrolase [Cohnella nanjingensis]|uniref:Serine hydrolase n=1 Tax=Cohnella nanjingensis TaxID=1387779 RepID=A0A7X0VIM6_9BACL|nr:serine hydrolase domain-containing protein [Cohnella nanjingensis]MBB6674708.1 serine hydrolase [Cohnella nanjingensis]
MKQPCALRHLLAHTHGLREADGVYIREFAPGASWAYRSPGIAMPIALVRRLSGLTLREYAERFFFEPYRLRHTGWRTAHHPHLIYNICDGQAGWVGPNESPDGDQSNLFASVGDLARWGTSICGKAGRRTGSRCRLASSNGSSRSRRRFRSRRPGRGTA